MPRQQQHQQHGSPQLPTVGGSGRGGHSSASTSSSTSQQQQANTRRFPRRQRYNTVAISDTDDDDDDHRPTNETNNNNSNEDDVENIDIEEAVVATTTGSSNQTRRTNRRQQPYAAIPTSTTSTAAVATTATMDSSLSSSPPTVVMEVTILDFTHKRWPIQITTEHIQNRRSSSTATAAVPIVYDLKYIGSTIHNIPMQQQRLIYQGKLLNDDTLSLSSLGIQPHSSIVHLFPKPRVVIVPNNNSTNNDGTCTNSDTATTTATSSNSATNTDGSTTDTSGTAAGNGGAHIPVIVMDQSEVDRRSEILVLGHTDYVEAVSNVKLFSLMLLIISTIELLRLLSLYITPSSSTTTTTTNSNSNSYSNGNYNNNFGGDSAPAVHEHDDFFKSDDDLINPSGSSGSSSSSSSAFANRTSDIISSITGGTIDPVDQIVNHWTPLKYIDLLISIVGIYVSILGMRASNENCIRTARQYLVGTTITAIGWVLYNYIVAYEIDAEVDAHPERYYNNVDSEDGYYGSGSTSSDDAIAESYNNRSRDQNPYSQAFTALILPGMVWGLCIFRAWQFQNVLYDAELEAAERTNTTMEGERSSSSNTGSSNNNPSLGDVELSTFESRRHAHPRNDVENNNNGNNHQQTPQQLPILMATPVPPVVVGTMA